MPFGVGGPKGPDAKMSRDSIPKEKRESTYKETSSPLGKEAESRQVVEKYPELNLIQDVFSKGLISKNTAREPFSAQYQIDSEGLASFLEENKLVFGQLRMEQSERIERTPLPPVDKMNAFLQSAFVEVQNDLKELDLLPEDFKKRESTLSPLNLSYDPDKMYGRYLDYRYFHDPNEKEPPSANIEIGGKWIQDKATHVRDELKKIGISVAVEESIQLVAKHMLAHEYGHRITDAYRGELSSRHPFYKNIAHLGRGNVMRLDAIYDQERVLDEQVSQSFAFLVLSKTLAEKGHDYSTATAINRIVGADQKTQKQFEEFIGFFERKGLQPSEVQGAIWEAQEELTQSGNIEASKMLDLRWGDIGYYLEPFDADQMRSIVHGFGFSET